MHAHESQHSPPRRDGINRTAFLLGSHTARLRREAGGRPASAAVAPRPLAVSSRRRPRANRRGGQALLLAVLLMVFAALLGSTFITVVALNLNQTARQENLGSSRQAANAGVSFINDQLTNSAEGLDWRPWMSLGTLPPTSFVGGSAASQSGFNQYYNALERAKGWTTNVNTDPEATDRNLDGVIDAKDTWHRINADLLASPTNRCFVKFPDPRGAATNAGGPQYLAEVRPDVIPGTTTPTGYLKITTIGQTEDNPNAFTERVAYKAGVSRNPLVTAARTVTNWDFVRNRVPVTQVAATSAANTITVNSIEGFPPAPFHVTLGSPQLPTTAALGIRGALVQSVTPGAPAVLNLSENIDAARLPVVGERVELAAALGAPPTINYDNDAVGSDDPIPQYVVSGSTAPGSVFANGGLLWYGENRSRNLRSAALAGPTAPQGSVRASGLMVRMSGTNVQFSGSYQGSNTNGTLPEKATNSLLTNSYDPVFPGNWFDSDDQRLVAAEKDQLVSDGFNRLRGSVPAAAPLRQVAPIVPPRLEGAGNISRYREMTKFSQPRVAGDPQQAALYGEGEGIYIDNVSDVEKVFDTAMGRRRPMTNVEMKRMWFNDLGTPGSDLDRPLRRITPSALADVNASLEQKHLRGWVGAEEFRGRGVLIEILNDTDIAITREPREDGTALENAGPVAAKGWRLPNGTLRGDATSGGVYRRVLPWPRNGVIFAEGNVRIRGRAANPARSLTVVSMNNIYIEDSLSAGTKKILLLAKSNVVLNPTRVLGRPDQQTRLALAVQADDDTDTITVQDGDQFVRGDWIKIDTGANYQDFCVLDKTVSATTTVLKLDRVVSGTHAAGQIVRTIEEPIGNRNELYSNLSRFSHVVQRRLHLDATSAARPVRLNLRHGAERRDALSIAVDQGTSVANRQVRNLRLYNKYDPTQPHPADGIIRTAAKTMSVGYDENVPGPPVTPNDGGIDKWPGQGGAAVPADEDGAKAYRLAESASTTTPAPDTLLEDINRSHAAPDWKYNATALSGYEVGRTGADKGPPFYFLASIGNLFRYGVARTDKADPVANQSATDPFRNLPRTAAPGPGDVTPPFTVPMATSVAVYLNEWMGTASRDNAMQRLQRDRAGTTEVRQFGFSPTVGTGSVTPVGDEDALTTDDGFYSDADNGLGTSVSSYDARTLTGATVRTNEPNTLAMRLHPLAEPFFDDTGASRIPRYRLSRLKLEDATLDATGQMTALNPGYQIEVNAFVYAQEGSWLVIAGPTFDSSETEVTGDPQRDAPRDVKQDYVNLPEQEDTPGDTWGTLERTGNPARTDARNLDEDLDLDRNGVISNEEQVAVLRFRRYNYQIRFTGTIMENTSPTVRNSGTTFTDALVQNWMTKWATIRLDNPTDFTAAGVDAAITAKGRNIEYNFDPEAITQGTAIFTNTDTGFKAPVSPDLIYTD